MTHQEKLELEKLKLEIKKLRNENDIKTKEVSLLKQENNIKNVLVHDLDASNYKQKYSIASTQLNSLLNIDKQKDIEIEELKKKFVS